IGFGGPLAHVALLQQELLEKRRWVTHRQFLEGFTISQVLPGPVSTQLAIYIGYRTHKARGAILSGGAFILPAFLLMLALSWMYFRLGGVPAVQGLFYGMNPVVLAMIVLSGCSLARSAARGKPLAGIAAASAAGIGLFAVNIVAVFAMAGLLALLLAGPRQPGGAARVRAIPPPTILAPLAWYFFKAGALLFGGGLVIVPLLEQDVVGRLQWLTHQEFFDGLALGQVTPGPVLISAAFIGYKVAGFLGALIATVAIFLPSFVFVLLGALLLERWRQSPRLQTVVQGVNAAAVGAILGACLPLSRTALTGPLPMLLFVASVVALERFQIRFWKVLAAGAAAGLTVSSWPAA
ncbi:MAG TPA: chromate efflux transporter, partial [Terriglobia bacterium]|nr:chromate efflux transporter [Terriglobia bacterium]